MNLIPIAIEAGTEILRIYETDFAVETKGDASPVTAADEAAEAIILRGLYKLAPHIPVVAEESVAAGQIPQTGERFFLVDPLDGTKEFVNRNGEFTVNIALIENGVPVAGVVYAPALGYLYVGGPQGAAMCEVTQGMAGALRPIHVRQPSPEGLIAIGSRSHGGHETQAYLERFRVRDFIAAGSSLKFCLIADGRADIYPRMGRTMEWDTAAGDAVLRAAGGRVNALDGQPLCYGKRDQADDTDFANPYFVAFGHASIISAP